MAVGGNLDVRKYFIVILKTMSSRVKRSHDRVVLGVEAVVRLESKKELGAPSHQYHHGTLD